MGKSAPAAPAAPDYTGAAVAQGQANLTAAQQGAVLSNPNVSSPLGNQTVNYSNIAGPDGQTFLQPNISQNLTPEAQQTLAAQQQAQLGLANLGNQALGAAGGILSNPFQYNGPGLTTSLDQNTIQQGTNNVLAQLQPQIAQNNAATTQQLANQGIGQGSEAWNNSMRQQDQNNNNLYVQASQQGFNNALAQSQFNNQAVAQNLSQQLGLYNQPLNQISALESGSQIQMPQFQGYSGQNVQAAPIANATTQLGQYNQNLYGQQVASYNSGMQGLGSLFGSAALAAPFIALSDIRLKSNIVRVGDHPLGIGIYEFDIGGERQRGVMAHEVEAVKPKAVLTLPSGYKAVNYGALNA